MVSGRPDNTTIIGQLDALLGDDKLELWQENEAIVHIFGDMITQWNIGPNGPVGLRYESLPVVLRLRRVAPADRPGVFDGLRVMERAALGVFRGE